MKIAVLTCVLAALLSTTARAEGAPLDGPFAFNAASTELTAEGDANAAASRVSMEILAGGLGGIGGGFAGLMIGASGGDLAAAGFGMFGGSMLGSWLGLSIGGNAMGGYGNWGASFVGALAGSATSLVLTMGMGANPDAAPFLLAMMIALPVTGGTIGYELSQSLHIMPSDGPLKSLHPSLSVSRDGKSALAGLSGTF